MMGKFSAIRGVMLIVVASFVVSGCASVESFKEMSVYERVSYVCSKTPSVRSLDGQISSLSSKISKLQSVIAIGYRTHKSCQRVRVPPAPQTCSVAVGLGGRLVNRCSSQGLPTYENVCQEIPVAIDGDLEERKLQNYQDSRKSLQSSRSRFYDSCAQKVRTMSAEEAFAYYERH